MAGMTTTKRYDDLGQVISGKKFWPDTSEVAGQQFGYGFDDIGNRVSTDTNGRPASYSPNNLNQYTQRTVPGAVDVIGSSEPDATVTVNNMATQRKGAYFHKELSVLNLATAQYLAISVVGVRKNAGPGGTDIVTEETGHAFVPKTPEIFEHDDDGNLTQDGRWIYTWDAENRLIAMETVSGLLSTVPGRRLEFAYDFQGRRISKKVYIWDVESSVFSLQSSVVFIYDGWNLITELTEVSGQMSVVRSHVWGLDLSGTEQGAGGVGGLLFTTGHLPLASSHFACFDGNGNVSALVDTATGNLAATYEYDPFGNLIARIENPASSIQNPFLFSTKYTDTETGLLYYGFRYYQPSAGRWLSRDPIGEEGGLTLYGFTHDVPINRIDSLGEVEPLTVGFIAFLIWLGQQAVAWAPERDYTPHEVAAVEEENIIENVRTMSLAISLPLAGATGVLAQSGLTQLGANRPLVWTGGTLTEGATIGATVNLAGQTVDNKPFSASSFLGETSTSACGWLVLKGLGMGIYKTGQSTVQYFEVRQIETLETAQQARNTVWRRIADFDPRVRALGSDPVRRRYIPAEAQAAIFGEKHLGSLTRSTVPEFDFLVPNPVRPLKVDEMLGTLPASRFNLPSIRKSIALHGDVDVLIINLKYLTPGQAKAVKMAMSQAHPEMRVLFME